MKKCITFFVLMLCLALSLMAQYFSTNQGQQISGSNVFIPAAPVYILFSDSLTLTPGNNNSTVLEFSHGKGMSQNFTPTLTAVRFYPVGQPGYNQYLIFQVAPTKWQTTNTYFPPGVYYVELLGGYDCPNGSVGDTTHIWARTFEYGNPNTTLDVSGHSLITVNANFCNPMAIDTIKNEAPSVEVDTVKVINVFPNPTQGQVTIEGSYSILRIFDVTGKLVIEDKKIINTLDMSDLAQGVYIFVFITENSLPVIKKVVKEQ